MSSTIHRPLGLLCCLAVAGTARASDELGPERACSFTRSGSTYVLEADCTTDASLVIPEGATLDGHGHTVHAQDPRGGAFMGAVVKNGGRVAHLRNLTIVADGLATACHAASPVDERLRAVLFEDASGTITGVHVRGVAQETLGCQEGHGIDVRALSERTDADDEQVLIAGCRVEGFQKSGIVVLGAVQVGVYANRVVGRGPLATLAQNGIQIGRGAHGSLKLNHVSDVTYTGGDWTAVAVLAQDAGPLDVALNVVRGASVGFWLERTSDAELAGNRVAGATNAVIIDGRGGAASANRVHHNSLRASELGVLLLGEGATASLVRENRVEAASGAALELLGAHDNTLR